jgi:hypothetical protein
MGVPLANRRCARFASPTCVDDARLTDEVRARPGQPRSWPASVRRIHRLCCRLPAIVWFLTVSDRLASSHLPGEPIAMLARTAASISLISLAAGCGGSSQSAPAPAAPSSAAASSESAGKPVHFNGLTAAVPAAYSIEQDEDGVIASHGDSHMFLLPSDELIAAVADPARCESALQAHVTEFVRSDEHPDVSVTLMRPLPPLPNATGCAFLGQLEGLPVTAAALGFGDRAVAVLCMSAVTDAGLARQAGSECARVLVSIERVKE